MCFFKSIHKPKVFIRIFYYRKKISYKDLFCLYIIELIVEALTESLCTQHSDTSSSGVDVVSSGMVVIVSELDLI